MKKKNPANYTSKNRKIGVLLIRMDIPSTSGLKASGVMDVRIAVAEHHFEVVQ